MTNVGSSLASMANPPSTPQAASRRWGPALAAIGLGLSTILLVHIETVSGAVSTWNSATTYKYAWAVLPTMAYVLWHNRHRLALLTPSGSTLGIFAAALCTLAWTASELSNLAAGRQIALVAAIGAVVLAAVGTRAFLTLAPMLSLLVFLVPSGGILLAPLKDITVSFVRLGAALTGLPFSNEGFAIHIGAQRYVVVDDCAGLPYLLTGLFLGLTLALLIYRSWWKIAALTLLGGGAGVLANGVRVIAIVLYDRLTGSELDLSGHSYFEWPALTLGFGLLFVIFSRLRPEPPAAADRSPLQTTARGTLKCSLSVLLAVALIAAGPLIWREPPQLVTNTTTTDSLPTTLSNWTKQDAASDWQPRVHSRAVSTSLATYTKGEQGIAVFVAQASSRRQKVSGGAIDLAGDARWMPGHQRELSVCIGRRCYAGQHFTLLLRDSDRLRHIYAFYVVGTDTTASLLGFRLRRAWARLTGEAAPARLIAIATEKADGLGPAEVGSAVDALMHQRSRLPI